MAVIEHTNTVGDTIRAWRQRAGMSQLSLAITVATSQRHVSFIERGRSRPGRSMLIRLTEAIGMPLRERNALLLDAGFAPVYTVSDLGSDDHAVYGAIRHVLQAHEPYPAVVVRPNGDILYRNQATAVLFDGVAPELLVDPINAYRVALHPRGMAPRISNFDQWAQHVLIALRAARHRQPSMELDALLFELAEYVAPPRPTDEHLGFAVPLRLSTRAGELRLVTTITQFANAMDVTVSELRLEAFLPADPESAELLHRLAPAAADDRDG